MAYWEKTKMSKKELEPEIKEGIREGGFTEMVTALHVGTTKWRTMAQTMRGEIEYLRKPRADNTPKRAREAMQRRKEALELEAQAATLEAMAEAFDIMDVKAAQLASVITTKDTFLYVWYHDAFPPAYPHNENLRFRLSQSGISEASYIEVKAMLTSFQRARAPETVEEEKLRTLLSDVKFARIPGYFVTPQKVVQEMIDSVAVVEGRRILEPSAGSGAIADTLKALGAKVDCVEVNGQLSQILLLKGHNLIHSGDFLELTPNEGYDAVFMNPPFEGGQDITHVMHALGFVRSGGVLVAIMSASTFFVKRKAAMDFREFLDGCGTYEKLPEDAFKESGTGVQAFLVVVRKR